MEVQRLKKKKKKKIHKNLQYIVVNDTHCIQGRVLDMHIKSVHRITIHNKLQNLAIPLQPERTSFVTNRTFWVYIFTFITMYIPAEV